MDQADRRGGQEAIDHGLPLPADCLVNAPGLPPVGLVVRPVTSLALAADCARLDAVAWGASGFDVPDGVHAWRVWAEYGYVTVVMAAGEVVGALAAFPTAVPGLHFLHKIFVAEQYRGSGAGAALLAQYCAFLDEQELRSVLTTAHTNTTMQALAARHGFLQVASVPQFYGPGKDRLLLGRAGVVADGAGLVWSVW